MGNAFLLTILPARRTTSAPADITVLAAAARGGMTLPSSCRNGTCRACLAHCISGQVRYEAAWPGLSADEKAEGWILPCIAYPLGDLEVVQPAMRDTETMIKRPRPSRGF